MSNEQGFVKYNNLEYHHNRQSNIELLRIIAMVMVIVLHVLNHGGIRDVYMFGTVGHWLFWLIFSLCFVAVNIFVLITGYFMSISQMKFSRLLKLSIQVETYSLICFFVSVILFRQKIGLDEIFKYVLPLTSNSYWFASAYAILIALAPLLNQLIKSMSQKVHILSIILLLLLFSVVPSIAFWSRNILTDGYNFIWCYFT